MLTRLSDRTYADPLPLIINMLTRFTDSLFIISDTVWESTNYTLKRLLGRLNQLLNLQSIFLI